MQAQKIALALLINIALFGCSSKEDVVPQSSTTMQDIYQQGADGVNGQSYTSTQNVVERPATTDEVDGWAYTLHNTPRADFHLLPNPTMYMYVKAHLSTSSRVPVPAYITEFKMYERDEYALAGERNLNAGENQRRPAPAPVEKPEITEEQ
ncbi:TIGR03751 family conjugal transfer lipoprotein [Motilimonas eburnea]|uniref:TIGR03751 family conjugal transfer lipoprotein n=1 Tax=Motilimonas eburnea TaxID=1737488 RepID=UPI001E4739FD|nr:TIGR03751 family conjugal transfer lipoprotein [Motilimonas eburnea]MCE2573849.1 TIGR03751 family conjugal transfer lipoprotein [Motilimonas eburnea]